MNNNITVLLLNGLISAGKDTVADILVKHKGYKKFSLASILKHRTSRKYGFDESLCNTQEGKKSIVKSAGKSVRELLIIESELAKSKNKYFFTDYVIVDIVNQDCEKVVISDFRFPEEYTRLTEVFSNVKTAKVVRPGVVVQDFSSEQQLDHFFFDEVIFNDTTIENLTNMIVSEDFF